MSKSYGYGGPSFDINPGLVSYVQPVQLVASGAPIAAIPLGPGYNGHLKSSYGVPSLGGLGSLPFNTYAAPSLASSYGAPPLSLAAGFGRSEPPLPAPVYKESASPSPVIERQALPVYNAAYNYNNQPVSYSCVCVPEHQCPTYDIIGRAANFNLTENDADAPKLIRHRRQINRRSANSRQTIVGDDTITVITSDSTISGSPAPTSPSNPLEIGTGFLPGGSNPAGGSDGISVSSPSGPSGAGDIAPVVGASAVGVSYSNY